MDKTQPPKRRPVNLSIRADIIADAKAYKINASEEAEKAIAIAVNAAKKKSWALENRDAIEAYNSRIDANGLYLKPYWMEDSE